MTLSKLFLTPKDIDIRAYQVSQLITEIHGKGCLKVYAVPRGGICAAYAVGQYHDFEYVDSVSNADIIIDDIIDSGKTKELILKIKNVPFYSLIEIGKDPRRWYVFPWEVKKGIEESIQENVRRMLQYIEGEDATREGLKDTPERTAKAWEFATGGYTVDVDSLLKCFEDGSDGVDEMVIVKNIPFYSQCEHHLATFFGTATVAYIPKNKIVGLSKINRLVDAFARRLQVQERLTKQVADALDNHLQPLGVAVLIKARHMCMESRGVRQQGHITITCALRGVMKKDAQARTEFLKLAE